MSAIDIRKHNSAMLCGKILDFLAHANPKMDSAAFARAELDDDCITVYLHSEHTLGVLEELARSAAWGFVNEAPGNHNIKLVRVRDSAGGHAWAEVEWVVSGTSLDFQKDLTGFNCLGANGCTCGGWAGGGTHSDWCPNYPEGGYM